VVETELQRHMSKGFRNPYMFYKTPSQGVATFLVAAFDPGLIGTFLAPARYVLTLTASRRNRSIPGRLPDCYSSGPCHGQKAGDKVVAVG
jgi:hypothetical protein